MKRIAHNTAQNDNDYNLTNKSKVKQFNLHIFTPDKVI